MSWLVYLAPHLVRFGTICTLWTFLNMFCNLNRNWSLVPGPNCFPWSCPFKRDWVRKKIPFQNILFLKEFLACNGCFGLFTKIRKGSGTSFCYIFSPLYFHKNVPNLILYQLTKFQCHTFFPTQDIKQNVLTKFLLR